MRRVPVGLSVSLSVIEPPGGSILESLAVSVSSGDLAVSLSLMTRTSFKCPALARGPAGPGHVTVSRTVTVALAGHGRRGRRLARGAGRLEFRVTAVSATVTADVRVKVTVPLAVTVPPKSLTTSNRSPRSR